MAPRGRLVSRIRQIKPSWFLDKELRRGTSAEAREFYIGLWMLADDDGYLVWDVERIAAELYPYDPDKRRERNVERWAEQLERLSEQPHLIVLTCGHASVPKMPAHQRIQGTRTTSVHKKHVETCRASRSRVSLQVATEASERSVATRSPGRVEVGNGKERRVGNGSAGARAPEGAAPASELGEGLARHGWTPPAKVPA
jgi:hypothetical protein